MIAYNYVTGTNTFTFITKTDNGLAITEPTTTTTITTTTAAIITIINPTNKSTLRSSFGSFFS